MQTIQIGTLLDHLSNDEKERMLRGILTDAFLSKDGIISPEKPRPGNPISGMQIKLSDAIDKAQKNVDELAKVQAEDESLDDTINESFDSNASEINNGGSHEQARFLIVEAGWKAEQVNQTSASFEGSLSEIPG